MILLLWIGVLASSIALYLYKVYSRFSKYGVRHMKLLPFVGNSGGLVLRKITFADNMTKLHQAFPEDRFTGNFEFLRPKIVLRDLDIIKNIVVKDYEYFLDHSMRLDDTIDPLFGRLLLCLRGQKWKDMRSALSPAFTSSKMRLMVPFMNEVSIQMMKSLRKRIDDSKDKYIDEECRDLSSRFANDVIASCAFGVKVDSHNDKDNEFFKMGKETTTISFKQLLAVLALDSFPNLMKNFNIPFFGLAKNEFFWKLVMGMINEREEKNIYRPDMIHLLMQAKKGKLTYDAKIVQDDVGFATAEEIGVGKKDVTRVWTENDLTAQAVTFFFAGFDTVSTSLSFLLHEIALNTKVQERLVQEIKEDYSKNGDIFDYKSVQNMNYMDMVVSESLRKWPPVPFLDRICINDYNLGKPHEKAKQDYIIRKGEAINIPSWAIQNDPEYYPNPEKFDLERFSEENKHLIRPFTYMPFGLGPRNRIGSRFALCEIKVMLYHLLLNFELSPCENTCIPAKLDTTPVTPRLVGGHWLRFTIRQ